jgi:hypothetical protein
MRLLLVVGAFAGVSAILAGTPAYPSSFESGRGARAAGIPLAPTPPAVRRFCRDRAHRHKFQVLCPARWPHVATSMVTGSGSSVLGPSFYWGSFNDDRGFDDGDNGHLILGGQRPPFSLAGMPKDTWPRPGQREPIKSLGLPRYITTPAQGGRSFVAQRPARVLKHSTVGSSRALVLVAPDYPTGGFMGGHIIVLWNRGGHGYFVSLHYDGPRSGARYTQAQRVNAALAIGRSARPFPG